MKKAGMIAGSLLIAIILAIVTGAVGVEKVQACSCAANPDPKEMLNVQDFVFAGKAVAVKTKMNIPFFSASSEDPVRVGFQVSEVWKGAVASEMTVYTAESGASCGVDFKPGTDYIVYGNIEDGKLQVNLCGGTKVLSGASADLAAFGKGETPPAPNGGDGVQIQWMPMLITAAAIGLLVAFIVYVRNRKRTLR